MLRGRGLLLLALFSFLVACDGGVREDDPRGGQSAEQGGDGDAGGTAAGGGGAGGTANGDPDPGGGGGACPEQQPAITSDCSDAWLDCEYRGDDGCPVFVTCFEYLGRISWVDTSPSPGGACEQPGKLCEYAVAVGDSPTRYYGLRCDESRTWESDDLCPEALPEAGSPCAYGNHLCDYDVCGEIDGEETSAWCSSPERTWSITARCASE
ncbi:hypothetical protein [Sorangium sp. So ce542]|uniref:hypothetical protein n=1 Tax=Sorangium sp. So ce542 TaxID=3133316 RepID=UPI003F62AD19